MIQRLKVKSKFFRFAKFDRQPKIDIFVGIRVKLENYMPTILLNIAQIVYLDAKLFGSHTT